jgi:beta-phosphoglucomutase family hydrolase
MTGLPDHITAVLFDLDGVLTDTAAVHSVAWHEAFTRFLDLRTAPGGPAAEPFRYEDYLRHVDGKTRADGVRDFLASRDIALPDGAADDAPGFGTVHALANYKNVLLLRHLERRPADVFDGSRRFLHAVRSAGLRRAVVSASANAGAVLDATGLAAEVEVLVDGSSIARHGLRGKPEPDAFLDAARQLRVRPEHAAVVEDAVAGVSAGRAGCFGLVIGVDRGGNDAALRAHGADLVVRDLADLMDAA